MYGSSVKLFAFSRTVNVGDTCKYVGIITDELNSQIKNWKRGGCKDVISATVNFSFTPIGDVAITKIGEVIITGTAVVIHN